MKSLYHGVIGVILLLLAPFSALAERYSEALTINLSLSGGGFRASAFAYGAMLELKNIGLCWKLNDDRRYVLQDITYAGVDANYNPEQSCDKRTSLLDQVHIISSVSGGSFTAAYYMTHDDKSFRTKFRDKLLDVNSTLDLALRIQTRSVLPAWLDVLYRPLLFLTSGIDTVKYFATLPFKIVPIPGLSETPNPDLTPAIVLGAGQGLISPDEFSQAIGRWFFEDRRHAVLGSLRKKAVSPDSAGVQKSLIINASDVSNRRGFSFDEATFRCLGLTKQQFDQFPLEVALASSAAIPVLVAPYTFPLPEKDSRPDREGLPGCNPPLYSRTTPPLLMDGGVIDNLGLEKLVNDALLAKSASINSPDPSKKFYMLSVNAAVKGGAGILGWLDKPSISQDIDWASDALMGHKTDVTRTIYHTSLSTFGFGFSEFAFSDLEEDPELLRLVSRVGLDAQEWAGTTTHVMADIGEDEALRRQSADKLLNQIHKIGMRPNEKEMDLVIAVGRAVVMKKFPELRDGLLKLSQQSYRPACSLVLNPDREYCFPQELDTRGQTAESTRLILKTFDRAKEDFIKKTTERRSKGLELIKGRLQHVFAQEIGSRFREEKDGRLQEKSIKQILCQRVPTVDRGYNHLIGQIDLAQEIRHFQDQCSSLADVIEADVIAKMEQAECKIPTNQASNPSEPGKDSCDKNKRRQAIAATNTTIVHMFEQGMAPVCNVANPIAWCYRLRGTLHLAVADPTVGNSSTRPDFHGERALRYFLEGIERYPDDMYLNAWYGYGLIAARKDFLGGLSYLKHAIDINKVRIEEMERLDTAKRLLQGKDADQHLRYDYALILQALREHGRLYKYRYVRLALLSPGPLPDAERMIHDQDVENWLKGTYPDVFATLRQDRNLHTLSHQLENVCSELSTITQMECLPEASETINGSDTLNVERLEKEISKHVRTLLSDNAGMVRARRYASELYDDRDFRHRVIPKPLVIPAENLGTFLMVEQGEAECPRRGKAFAMAASYLVEARDFLGKAYFSDFIQQTGPTNGNEYRSDLPLLYQNSIDRVEQKLRMTARLQCWRPNLDTLAKTSTDTVPSAQEAKRLAKYQHKEGMSVPPFQPTDTDRKQAHIVWLIAPSQNTIKTDSYASPCLEPTGLEPCPKEHKLWFGYFPEESLWSLKWLWHEAKIGDDVQPNKIGVKLSEDKYTKQPDAIEHCSSAALTISINSTTKDVCIDKTSSKLHILN